MESDQSTVAPIETVVDVPGTADGFSALTNRGDVNEKGTTDEMDWSEMGLEEAQDQQNDAGVLDICPTDIISCYWEPDDEKLMLWIFGLPELGEEVMKAEDMRVDYESLGEPQLSGG